MLTTRVELTCLAPNPRNPRTRFDEAGIRDLAGSIERFGLLSPLVVRKAAGGRYELIAGERRLRALRLLGRASADCVVLDEDDLACRLIALIENLEREDLHYLEEAAAYREILREHNLKQEELAKRLNLSPSTLANRLRLLKLSAAVVRLLSKSEHMTERHARALLKFSDPARQLEAAVEAERGRLSVRRLEALVEQKLKSPPPRRNVTRLFRDSRMFVNAVIKTVRELNALGIGASSRVERLSDRIVITVTLPEGPGKF